MSVQDPGAATGTGLYPSQRRCSCTHSEALHAYGRHKGRNVRKACNAVTKVDGPCRCPLFVEEGSNG